MRINDIIKHNMKSHLISKIPFTLYTAIKPVELIINYYHMINDEEVLHIKHLYPHKTVEQFRADLDFILKHFTPITLNDLLVYQKHGRALPSKAMLLTFDDGFREMHDIVAPILSQKGVSATFFINSSFTDNRNLCYQHKASILVNYILQKSVSAIQQKQISDILLKNNIKTSNINTSILAIKYAQRELVDSVANLLNLDFNDYLFKNKPYLSTEQIKKLINDGFSIGSHSIDHPLYEDLKMDEQIRQTIDSVSYVRKNFDLDYGAFAFPHSDIGVSKQYFNEIEKSGLVDISFGTAGIIQDCVSNHFQRFSLERPLMPAANIFALQFAKRLWRKMKHSNKITRP